MPPDVHEARFPWPAEPKELPPIERRVLELVRDTSPADYMRVGRGLRGEAQQQLVPMIMVRLLSLGLIEVVAQEEVPIDPARWLYRMSDAGSAALAGLWNQFGGPPKDFFPQGAEGKGHPTDPPKGPIA